MEKRFIDALSKIPDGYGQGYFRGQSYGVSVSVSENKQRIKLFAEALDGSDIVSFNLYRFSDGSYQLRPCEMSTDKVITFVLEYEPVQQ